MPHKEVCSIRQATAHLLGATLKATTFFNGVFTDSTVVNLGTAVPTASDIVNILPATMATLPPGDVTVYVRAQDDTSAWGPVNSAVITAGPKISGMSLNSSSANGTKAVDIRATADETLIGNIDVVAAEYFIGTTGANGSGIPMDLNRTAPISSLSAQIDAATIQGMTPGDYPILIHAQDVLGNWGGFGTINLKVDKVGPVSTGVSLAPNPNNGTLTVNSFSSGVRNDFNLTGYKVSFDFSPNGAVTADEEQQIFTASDSNGNGIFGIMFEQGPDGPEVQAWALQGSN